MVVKFMYRKSSTLGRPALTSLSPSGALCGLSCCTASYTNPRSVWSPFHPHPTLILLVSTQPSSFCILEVCHGAWLTWSVWEIFIDRMNSRLNESKEKYLGSFGWLHCNTLSKIMVEKTLKGEGECLGVGGWMGVWVCTCTHVYSWF